MCRE